MNTAKVKERMVAGGLRRGSCGGSHKCYMNQEDFRRECVRRLTELEELRGALYLQLGSPNKFNVRKWKGRENKHKRPSVLVRYFEVGEEMSLVKSRLSSLNKMTRESDNLSELILDVARERLSEFEWNSIVSEAKSRNKKPLLESEWVKIVDAVSGDGE